MPVHNPTEEETLDPSLYAENVRNKISQHINLPTTEYSYEDRLLMRYAKKINYPREHAVVEFFTIKNEFSVSFEFVAEKLQEFSEIVERGEYEASKDDFLNKFIGLTLDSKITDCTWAKFDRNQRGKINFKEFVFGVCLAAKDEGVLNECHSNLL